MRTADQAFRDRYCWSPSERRKLARANSGRRRQNARRVPMRRPPFQGLTMAALRDAASLYIRSPFRMWVTKEEAPYTVVVEVETDGEIETFAEWVRMHAPAWGGVTVRKIDRRPWTVPAPEPGNLSAEERAELAAMSETIKYATADAEWRRKDRPRDWVGEKRAEEVIAWALGRIREIRGGLPIAPGVATSAKPCAHPWDERYMMYGYEFCGAVGCGKRLEVRS